MGRTLAPANRGGKARARGHGYTRWLKLAAVTATRLPGVRLAVYTDFPYHRADGRLYAEQAFALFVARLATRMERLVVVGRLDPDPASARHPLPDGVEFVALPHYPALTRPLQSLTGMAQSLRRFWTALEMVDSVWLLGPHPLSLAFVLIARLRGRSVAIGVRQDLPAYVERRHPGRLDLAIVARLLESSYRLLSRIYPTVVVGPALRRLYKRAPRLLAMIVSLVEAAEIVTPGEAADRTYEGPLQVLSVGRLDAEKNPLMLADVLAALRDTEIDRWRLVVCGDGPLRGPLASRLEQLELGRSAELRGYLPVSSAIRKTYRESHFLLLTSWTEGFPQVILEAFAAGVPVVATDVGGIREQAGDAVELVPAGDPAAAARSLLRLASDDARRRQLVEAGIRYAHRHTGSAEADRLASFLAVDRTSPVARRR